MPRHVLQEWIAYHEVEPWGQDRADARSAIIASLVYNANRRRGAPARPPRDFFAFQAPRGRMSQAKIEAFKVLMRRAGATNSKPIGSPDR